MKRYDTLDGLRGYFLVFMMLGHLTFQGGPSLLKWVNHNKFGFVEDAQGFVFLSGLISGLYYMRLYRQGQVDKVRRKLVSRAFELYRYFLASVVLLIVVAVAFEVVRPAWTQYLGSVQDRPIVFGLLAATMVYQPTYTGILTQYIVYLLATPLLLKWIAAGRWREVLGGSVLMWLGVQLGLHLPLLDAVDAVLGRVAHGYFQASFNPLAWQIIFVSGLLIGTAEQTDKLDRELWFPKSRPVLLWAALGTAFVFFVFRTAIAFNALGSGPLGQRFLQHLNRPEFGLVYLLNFAAAAYIVAWLLNVGTDVATAPVRTLAKVLHGLVTLRPLTYLGKHSLQIFSFHVLVAYLVMVVDSQHGPFSQLSKVVISLLAVASLGIPAWLHERSKQKERAVVRVGTTGA